jgi:hypothetical protein
MFIIFNFPQWLFQQAFSKMSKVNDTENFVDIILSIMALSTV